MQFLINNGVNVLDVSQNQRERAVLVGVAGRGVSRYETDDSLDELALLAGTAGAEVVDRVMQERARIDPTYYIGRGKAEFLGGTSGTHQRVMPYDPKMLAG